jgi:hypothetical protein
VGLHGNCGKHAPTGGHGTCYAAEFASRKLPATAASVILRPSERQVGHRAVTPNYHITLIPIMTFESASHSSSRASDVSCAARLLSYSFRCSVVALRWCCTECRLSLIDWVVAGEASYAGTIITPIRTATNRK